MAQDSDVADLIKSFANQLPDRVAAIDAVLKQGDIAATQKLAHQLKGAAGLYGFAKVAVAAGNVEKAAKDGADISSIARLVVELVNSVKFL